MKKALKISIFALIAAAGAVLAAVILKAVHDRNYHGMHSDTDGEDCDFEEEN
ncbi:MAG: hypothetical protein K6E85_01425 [Lachnospiraceae bacterium]|nr:hypothetical protein [Lachnospiraceae bacterium]